MKVICECGTEGEIIGPDGLMAVTGFFRAHNCWPSKITLVCGVCGECHDTGPFEKMNPLARGERDARWYLQHQHPQ